jgi:hypothetical protein
MLPTDISKFAQGKGEPELRDAHRAHHERLHAPAIIVAKPSADPAVNVAALNAAIAAAVVSGYGTEVVIAPGVYALDKPIEIRGANGLRMRGSGAGTAFVWKGPPDQPVFRVVMSRECVFSDFRVFMEAQGYAAIQVLRDNGAGHSPTHNRFSNLLLQLNNTTAYGVVVGGVGMVDANNDFALFDHCTLETYTDTGFVMLGSQSYNNQFINCMLWGGTGARYGYYTGTAGASFRVCGGGMIDHSMADFYIGHSYQPYVIQFINSENGARFIEAPNDAYRQVVIEHCRWAARKLHKDGRAIVVGGKAYLSLRYCSIGDGNPTNAPLYLDFKDTRPDIGGGVVMEGCRVFSSAENVFPSDAPVRVETCTKLLAEYEPASVLLTTAG